MTKMPSNCLETNASEILKRMKRRLRLQSPKPRRNPKTSTFSELNPRMPSVERLVPSNFQSFKEMAKRKNDSEGYKRLIKSFCIRSQLPLDKEKTKQTCNEKSTGDLLNHPEFREINRSCINRQGENLSKLSGSVFSDSKHHMNSKARKRFLRNNKFLRTNIAVSPTQQRSTMKSPITCLKSHIMIGAKTSKARDSMMMEDQKDKEKWFRVYNKKL
ncbi:unnamed protein product [Moneuplotes crassus]|uniref:Uncharacterized protein n=1 Tax=Euplotes crassus TaxID=5936 RepID=A0AAD1U8A3_EUPCR|nr:unnamed protein product [Moneuplotes crassus]